MGWGEGAGAGDWFRLGRGDGEGSATAGSGGGLECLGSGDAYGGGLLKVTYPRGPRDADRDNQRHQLVWNLG